MESGCINFLVHITIEFPQWVLDQDGGHRDTIKQYANQYFSKDDRERTNTQMQDINHIFILD